MVKSFKEKWMSTDDRSHSGRPQVSVNDETIATVHALLKEDQWWTVCETEQQIVAEYPYVNISLGSIYTIMNIYTWQKLVLDGSLVNLPWASVRSHGYRASVPVSVLVSFDHINHGLRILIRTWKLQCTKICTFNGHLCSP